MESSSSSQYSVMFNLKTRTGDALFLHLADLDRIISSHRDSLSKIIIDSEQLRADQFRRKLDRERYLASRWFLRKVLGKYTKEYPGNITIAFTDKGKPYLADHRLFFNLAHSENYIVIGITTAGEIGVDLEVCRSIDTAEEVSPVILSNGEYAYWQTLPRDDRLRTFLRFWILKEAILKAAGTGLTIDPKDIELRDTGKACPSIASLSEEFGQVDRWQIGLCNQNKNWPIVAWALRK